MLRKETAHEHGFFGPSAERNSWFGGLNAGVKCVVTVVLILAAILIKDPVSATVMLVLELVGFTVVGFRPVNLLARAWPILVAVASTGWSVAILVNKTGPVILDFGVNSITQGSLAAAVSMMLRSLAMVLPTFAFVLSTDPTDLGIRWRRPSGSRHGLCWPRWRRCAWWESYLGSGIRWGRRGVPAGWARGRARGGGCAPVRGRCSR
ncbi:transmembrane component YkoC [Rothia aeria]|uniref:Transmembrane component YkoC n=1 Tax=Rothia aeria TaxID=172042 RepID=A0A2Z5R3A9_9MICC|nr:transmembrane component YkoC [Rothia aeria]